VTVQNTTTRVSFSGNGTTTAFPFAFPVQEVGHLVVTLRSSAGVETVQAYGIKWSITGTSWPAGGSVVMVTAPATGETLVVERTVPLTQNTSFPSQGSYLPESHERAIDRAVMAAQQLATGLTRTPQLKTTDTDGAGQYDAKGNRLGNLGTPTAGADAATRTFVEGYATAFASGGGQNLPAAWTGTGNGAAVDFAIAGATLSGPEAYIVTLNGVVQRPTTDYTVSLTPSPKVTFTVAPANAVKVDVRSIGYARPVTAPGIYTEATKPTASAATVGVRIHVRDGSNPTLIQEGYQKSDGSYAWGTVFAE
jgi:hypothetical protein